MKLSDDESQLRLLADHVRLLVVFTRPWAVLPHVILVLALVLCVRRIEQTTVSKRLFFSVNLAARSNR